MNRRLNFIIFFAISVCALEIFADEFFKVPLDVREKNRPQRLVDNLDDPDMRALKEIQDKFFNIVGNSSVGKEFKSFKQLLNLVDSKAGIELGKLMFQGIMIAYGKDNSNQLLNEFIDDFQYRISPDLADALIDYKDFLKTVDLKMIPLTLQALFRKDELGNSLAQMPLGQLVDLIQPEASKYGIDIKAVINGILGKGDSTFPDLIKKLLDNFDVPSLLKNLPKLESSDSNEITKRQRKDPALMMFKPFISKILKENKIDLEPDAVIQVLTPFVAPILQSFMPSTVGKDGKQQNGSFDFSQLLPMLTLLGSQFGQAGGSAKKTERLSESELSKVKKIKDKAKSDSAENVMNVLSGLLQMSDNLKKGKLDDTDAGSQQDLLQLAMTLMGNMGGKDKKDDPMANLLNLAAGALQMSNNEKQSGDSSAKTMALLQSAMSLMGNLGDKKSDSDPMAGLLGLASAFMGKKDGKSGDPMTGLLSLASAFMDKKGGKDGDPMAGLLGLASSFMQNAQDGKGDFVQIITNILGGPNGKDIRSMVKMAAALFGTGKNKRKDATKQIDESPESRKARIEERKKRLEEYKQAIKTDPRYLAAKENVETVLSDLKEMENETVSELGDEKLEKEISKTKVKKETKEERFFEEDKFERTESFPYAFEEFVHGLQSDKSVLSIIQQVFNYGKVFISSKFRTRNDIESYLTATLQPYDKDFNVKALTTPFYLTEKQFGEFLTQLNKEEIKKNKFVSSSSGDLIKKLLDEGVNERLMAVLSNNLHTIMLNFGVRNLTFDNFPDKVGLMLTVLSKNQGLPDVGQLLQPLQYSLKHMKNWYLENIQEFTSMPQKELQELLVESLYNEIILPIKHLWKIRQVSKSTKLCLPREVCNFVNNIDEENVVETLVSQIGSILYGAYASELERNPVLFIETVRAAVYKGNCEEAFPISCEMKTKKEDDDFQYEHIEL